jgi:hypothetical protein
VPAASDSPADVTSPPLVSDARAIVARESVSSAGPLASPPIAKVPNPRRRFDEDSGVHTALNPLPLEAQCNPEWPYTNRHSTALKEDSPHGLETHLSRAAAQLGADLKA